MSRGAAIRSLAGPAALAVLAGLAVALPAPAGADGGRAGWLGPGFGDGATATPGAAGLAVTPTTLSLNRALDHALDHNVRIRQAQEELQRRKGVWVELRSGVLPHLRLEASYAQEDPGRLPSFGGETFGSDKTWSAGVVLEQVVYGGGRAISTAQRESALAAAAGAGLQAAAADVALTVIERYWAVQLALAEATTQARSVALLSQVVEDAVAKEAAGAQSSFDVLRARVALANQQTPLQRARNRVRLSYQSLREAVGPGADLPPVEALHPLPLTAAAAQVPPPPPSAAPAVTAALARRPDLAVLGHRLEAARQQGDVARSGYLPNVRFQADYSVEKSPFTDPLTDTIDGWTFMLQGTWPLFDGLASRGAKLQAEADRSSTRVELTQQRFAAALELSRTHADLTEALGHFAATAQIADQAVEALRLARARLDAGAATQLDVLDAQVALTEARTNAARAAHDVLVARARWDRARGLLVADGGD